MLSLKTLPQATAQEVFDHVAKHLLTQKRRAINRDFSCRYRLRNLRCAAGCLIADDEYKESFEGWGWDVLVEENKAPKKHIGLITSLQSVHDECPPKSWYQELYELAGAYRLNRKALKEFK